VHGSVLSGKGTALFVGNSTIRGSVHSRGGTLVGVCGTSVRGSVLVTRASRFVVIGDPRDDGCATNRVGGQVSLRSDRGGTELSGNHIGGTVNARGNSGTGPFPEDFTTEIEANTIGGSLHCTGNSPPPTNDGQPNSVTGSRTQQCAGF
jgi:hypothetical protein